MPGAGGPGPGADDDGDGPYRWRPSADESGVDSMPAFPRYAIDTDAEPQADDFPRLVRQFASSDPSRQSSRAAGLLWAIRSRLGELLGWDRPDAGLGARVPSLSERLPSDLRAGTAILNAVSRR